MNEQQVRVAMDRLCTDGSIGDLVVMVRRVLDAYDGLPGAVSEFSEDAVDKFHQEIFEIRELLDTLESTCFQEPGSMVDGGLDDGRGA